MLVAAECSKLSKLVFLGPSLYAFCALRISEQRIRAVTDPLKQMTMLIVRMSEQAFPKASPSP